MTDHSDQNIDHGRKFDFGRIADEYARYRDIYPASMLEKLQYFQVVQPGMTILDIGTGTGVIPRGLVHSGAVFYGVDIAPEQIREAERLSAGMGIRYAVAPAEDTPFADNSFDAVIACQCFCYLSVPRLKTELQRILRPRGCFCRLFMSWLPFESEIAAATETLVLKYNPSWTGGRYRPSPYQPPAWIEPLFELETYHQYRVDLPFSIDGWCGRQRACRGVGASLPPAEVAAFDLELHQRLRQFGPEPLLIKHLITMEVFRRID